MGIKRLSLSIFASEKTGQKWVHLVLPNQCQVTEREKRSKSCLWSQPKYCAHPRSQVPSPGVFLLSMRLSAASSNPASLDAAQDCPAPSCTRRGKSGIVSRCAVVPAVAVCQDMKRGLVLQPHLALLKLSHHGTSSSHELARWSKHPQTDPSSLHSQQGTAHISRQNSISELLISL